MRKLSIALVSVVLAFSPSASAQSPAAPGCGINAIVGEWESADGLVIRFEHMKTRGVMYEARALSADGSEGARTYSWVSEGKLCHYSGRRHGAPGGEPTSVRLVLDPATGELRDDGEPARRFKRRVASAPR